MKKIHGSAVATTLPKSDWLVDDPKKGGYIKNKPKTSNAVFVGTTQTNVAEFGAAYDAGMMCFVKADFKVDLGATLFTVTKVVSGKIPGYTETQYEVYCYCVAKDGLVYTGRYTSETGWQFTEKNEDAEVFRATGDATTFEEILAAYNANKLCYLTMSGCQAFSLVRVERTSGAIFTAYDPATASLLYAKVSRDNVWEHGSVAIRITDTIPNDASRDKYIPNVGAVRAALAAKLDESKLPAAINNALTEAKASGAFKGDPGKDGTDGADGKNGQNGVTPKLTIGTVETLEEGSAATATITGTDTNPVLNLGIPKGEKWEGAVVVNLQRSTGGPGYTASMTYQEIAAANYAGKLVLLLYSGILYIYSFTEPSGHNFERFITHGNYGSSDGFMNSRIVVNSSDKWNLVNGSVPFSVTSISEESHDYEVPTAKAVYDYVNTALGVIENGTY